MSAARAQAENNKLEQAKALAQGICDYVKRPQPWQTYGELPNVDELTGVILNLAKKSKVHGAL